VKANTITVALKTESTTPKVIIDNFIVDGLTSNAGSIAFGTNFSKVAFAQMSMSKIYTVFSAPTVAPSSSEEPGLGDNEEDSDEGGSSVPAEPEGLAREDIIEFKCHSNKTFNSRKRKCTD